MKKRLRKFINRLIHYRYQRVYASLKRIMKSPDRMDISDIYDNAKRNTLVVASTPEQLPGIIQPSFFPGAVLIYTAPRTASNLIVFALKKAGLRFLQTHYLTEDNYDLLAALLHQSPSPNSRIAYFYSSILCFRHWMQVPDLRNQLRFISTIRDPIGRFLSHIEYNNHLVGNAQQYIEECFGKLSDKTFRLFFERLFEYVRCRFMNRPEGIKPFTPKELFVFQGAGPYAIWQDVELFKVFSDVPRECFDCRDKPFVTCNNVLLQKFEALDELPQALSTFLGIDTSDIDFPRLRRPDGQNPTSPERAVFTEHFKEAMQKTVFPQDVLDFFYSSESVRILYSSAELDAFRDKWTTAG